MRRGVTTGVRAEQSSFGAMRVSFTTTPCQQKDAMQCIVGLLLCLIGALWRWSGVEWSTGVG
jgi:hypothetical protein